MPKCYQCDEELDELGNCPFGCTENPDYELGNPGDLDEGIDPDDTILDENGNYPEDYDTD